MSSGGLVPNHSRKQCVTSALGQGRTQTENLSEGTPSQQLKIERFLYQKCVNYTRVQNLSESLRPHSPQRESAPALGVSYLTANRCYDHGLQTFCRRCEVWIVERREHQ
jgi:hypothetical protein